MKRKLRAIAGTFEQTDHWLLVAVGILLFLGSIVVYGAGSYTGRASGAPFAHQYYIILRHLFMIGLGLIALVFLMHFDYRHYRLPWLNIGVLFISYALVAATLVVTRQNSEGQEVINRWVSIGGFRFQPVELAKLAMVVFLAARLTCLRDGRRMPLRQVLLALALGPLPLLIMLVMQPNFGNAMVTIGVTLVVLFAAGVSDRWLLRVVLAVPVAGLLGFVFSHKVHARVVNLWVGLKGGSFGYQVDQSLIGLATGGLKGLGPGQSHNKFSFLPESHTDFAFSVLGEEWGLIGTLLVIGLIVLIAWRGYGIAARASEPFGRALAAGLTTAIAIYGVANIAMVTGLFPVVGVPLPFVSYGGTAMVACLASVGILLNIEQGGRSYNQWKRRWNRSVGA